MALKLKLDANGNVVVQDGKPVYVHEDGKEIPFDAEGALNKIRDLNAENKSHREAAETANTKLKMFDGVDPEAAKKALELAKNLDDKKLLDTKGVEELKAQISASFKSQIEDIQKEAQKAAKKLETQVQERDGTIFNLMVTNRFHTSEFVKKKVAVPSDMIEAAFGKHFKVENGKVVGYKADGSPIYSRKSPGETADFDEALEIMVDGYPHKDHILKGSGSSGNGTPPGGSKQAAGKEIMDLPPAERIAAARAQGKS